MTKNREKRILLPTDFSENAWNAIDYAVNLFKDEDCIFYLLNTYTPVIYHVEYVLVNPAQFGMGDPIRENSERCLHSIRDRILKENKNPRHKIECISAFNTLIPEILEVVNQKSIDLVVMGTKGATGTKEVLFGSNTVHVFKGVNCPVMAIPDDYPYEQPQEILFPTDYKVDYEKSNLELLGYLSDAMKTRINVLHVMEDEDLSEDEENNKLMLKEKLGSGSVLFHDLEGHSVPEVISNFQQRARINLLVMINNKHSFFENLFFRPTINQIGFHLNVPFLVFPA
ncbi:MAG: universal stress protein [Bacteroidia bacterium]|nr:universal stress protein [Bacteroidia bacterium]MBT8269470.1 universal stress protein [Bacteroidia bacterium]NNK70398.1 universal stress protein [Flavobacteriaceae bacterium]